jgi:hypothetical protein
MLTLASRTDEGEQRRKAPADGHGAVPLVEAVPKRSRTPVKDVTGRLLKDDVLTEQAEVQRACVSQLRKAAENIAAAEAKQAVADRQLEERRAAAERKEADAAEKAKAEKAQNAEREKRAKANARRRASRQKKTATHTEQSRSRRWPRRPPRRRPPTSMPSGPRSWSASRP